MENVFTWTSKHVGAPEFQKKYIFTGSCTTTNVRSHKNNVENNDWDEVNLFRFVLIMPIINNKFAQIVIEIKHEYK